MSLLDIFLSLPVYPLQVRILGILLISDMEKLRTLHQFRNENCKLEKDWEKKLETRYEKLMQLKLVSW